MQKPRRRSRLELHLLSVSGLLIAACAGGVRHENIAPKSANGSENLAPRASAFEAPRPNASRKPSSTPPAPASAKQTELHHGLVHAEPAPSAELPRGTLILHIGDSFAASLGIPLAKRLNAAGLRNVLEFKTASYIPTWAFGPELKRYLASYNPDLVLITLGANELELPNPEQRAGAIRRLIAAVGDKPCVWISPPLWKPDTGLLGVIRQNAAPCRYLDSDSVVSDLPRTRDRIHPSTKGREIWADAVLSWLTASRDPSGSSAWALRPRSETTRPSQLRGENVDEPANYEALR